MGGSKDYIESGGFRETLYKSDRVTANGIKVIRLKENKPYSTPYYSNTPNTTYAKANSKGDVEKISAYGTKNIYNRNSTDINPRAKSKDIDTGHSHTARNKRGKVTKRFKKTDIHVQEYDPSDKRKKRTRKASKKERRTFYMSRNKR